MKIGIDARLYGTKHGGIGRYSEQLIKNLEKIDTDNDYFIFLSREGFEAYRPQNKKFKKIRADYKVYGLFEQLLFPFQLYTANLDLVHFTHFNAPLLYAKKFIVTIHDLIISHYPSSRATTLTPLLYRLKLRSYDFLINLVARRAKKIIAVSQYTKDDIAKRLKIRPDKIAVVYEGVDLPLSNQHLAAKILVDLDIVDKYLLYVGSAYPHKNLEKLIAAFKAINEQLTAEGRSEIQLVLAGKNNFFYERLKEYAGKMFDGKDDRVVFTDWISDDKLVSLYENAECYVFPSLIEGFGLPPLEAQSYGLAVASSDKTCLPEVLGDGAIYFDPENPADMAEKMYELLTRPELKQELIRRGRQNTEKFSWRKMAEEILRIYQDRG